MAGSKPAAPPRLFVDSGVVIDAVVAEWSVPRCIFVLARSGIFKIVLAEAVRLEVETDFLRRLGNDKVLGTKILNAYTRLLRLVRPERVPLPPADQVAESRHLIRHEPDVPILRSAINAAPDWLVTTNTRHFTPAVALRCGIKIITPRELVRRASFPL